MSIKRSAPDIGYVNPSLFQQLNASQTVRANNMVYFSGIVAATGNGEAVAKDYLRDVVAVAVATPGP